MNSATGTGSTAGRSAVDARVAMWSGLLVLISLCVWAAAGEGSARYAIYSLPPTLLVLTVLLTKGMPQFDRSSIVALQMYGLVAALSIASAGYLGENTVRDLMIIGGYLCLYSLSFSAPRWVADVALVALVLGMAIESINEEIGTEIQFIESEGILESTLAFPLGALFIYFVLHRKPFRSLITFIVFFAAFKRIALLAALIALMVYLVVRIFRIVRLEKSIVVAIMLGCSILALFSMELFTFLGRELGGINATEVSLGRFRFAAALWEEWARGGIPQLIFGRGPGEADVAVFRAHGYNPHNDWLKILFDYGVFGLVAFYAILVKVFGTNPFRLCILTYTSILMISDNTLIYMQYHAVVFLLVMIPFDATRRVARAHPASGRA